MGEDLTLSQRLRGFGRWHAPTSEDRTLVDEAADRIEYLEAVEDSLWADVEAEQALADRLYRVITSKGHLHWPGDCERCDAVEAWRAARVGRDEGEQQQ